MVDDDVLHRVVLRVPGREPGSQRGGGRRDEAVGLRERPTSRSEVPAPSARTPGLPLSERDLAQSREQSASSAFFSGPKAADGLLDADGADVRLVAGRSQDAESLHCARPTAQDVYQCRGIEKDSRHSAEPAPIATPLGVDPRGRIRIPSVPAVVDRPDRRLDGLPPPLVFQRTFHRAGDETAAAARPDPPIQLPNRPRVQIDVHSHTHKMTHSVDACGVAQHAAIDRPRR